MGLSIEIINARSSSHNYLWGNIKILDCFHLFVGLILGIIIACCDNGLSFLMLEKGLY
jgi:hypothetical protein